MVGTPIKIVADNAYKLAFESVFIIFREDNGWMTYDFMYFTAVIPIILGYEKKEFRLLAVSTNTRGAASLADLCSSELPGLLRLFGWFGWFGWLFWVNFPLSQYFSLYQPVSQRGRKRREKIEESKNVQTTPSSTYCKRNRPLPYYHLNCRTPWHWKITQHHRTTRPPTAFSDQI